uniref:Protein Ycf2 n=1 Tax=Lathyrus venosus TaxID=1276802 RepID=A0A0F6NG87_9FABA|nr:hypothetical chloroplast RF21 [Lathyrus venosus]AIK21340.1 hypothetical chloroplast RF21 [Lathyrus venosus]
MKNNELDMWILELREIFRESKNSSYFSDSWTQFNSAISVIHIFFHQESLIKLLDSRIWSILVSRGLTRYFTIKNFVFFLLAILIYRINNRRMIEKKNIYLTGLLPIQINSIGSGNDPLEDSKDSFNINRLVMTRLIVPLLSGPKEKNISEFFADRWSELHLDLNPTEKSAQDLKLFKKEEDVSFVLSRQSENKEIANIVKIIMYLQKNVSIHPISSDGGCDRVAKDKLLTVQNHISFLNQNLVFGLFDLFHDQNRGGYLLQRDFQSEERFQEMANIFNLSITKPDLVYRNGFSFSIDFSKIDDKPFVNEVCNSRDESKKKSLLVLPRLFYEANESFYPKIIKKWVQTSCGNYFQGNRFNRNLEYVIQRYENDILNHIPRRKHMINQRFSNLKKSQKKCFDPLIFIYRTERSVNKDPNTDKYKWSKGSKNFQEHLDHFISEENSRFQVVFDRLHMNAYSIDWSEVIDKKDFSKVIDKKDFSKSLCLFLSKLLPFFSKSLCLFLSKLLPFFSNSLPFFFVSFGSMPVHRSQIHMDELKRMNDALGNQLLESIGLQTVHLKKKKALLLDDYYTSQKSKLLINEIANQHNWLNPVKCFHRSSLISSFYKVNRLRFLNNPYNFSFDCKKRFSFYGERSCNYDFLYEQFLNVLFSRTKIFSLGDGKKKHAFLDRDTISPSELEVSNILIANNFPQSGDDGYDLYKSFHFPTRVPRAIYSIADISGTPLTEEEIVDFERTYRQRLSAINLSDPKWKKLHKYLDFDSNIDLLDTDLGDTLYTLYSEKFLPSEKRKKKPLKKFLKKGQMYRKFQRKSSFSTVLSKWWKPLYPYIIPSFLTRTGQKNLLFLFIQTFSDLFVILKKSPKLKKFLSILPNVIHGAKAILRKKLFLAQQGPISEISSKCLHNYLVEVYEDLFHTNNESPFISTHLRSLNIQEFLFSILLLLLISGYLVHTHLFFVSRFSNELQTEFEQVKSLMIPSYIIELQKLLDTYLPLEQNSFWLQYIFQNALEQFENFREERRGSPSGGNIPRGKGFNLMDFISIIPNPINRIAFLKNTRHLSHTSKALYSLIKKRKNMNSDWINDKIESWISNSDLIADKERQFLLEFSTLTTEKRMDQILVSMTNSDELSKNNSGYQMIEQPGTIYLRYLFDIHKKDLMNYEFNTSCLAERRVFLAHYQTITYSKIPCAASCLDFPSHGKPFSLRLALSPARGILVIGSITTGQSYLLKSLATTSYVPFITVFVNKFLEDFATGFDTSYSEDDLFDDREGTIYSLLPDTEGSCYNPDNYERDNSDDFDRKLDSRLKFLSMEDPVSTDIIPDVVKLDQFYLTLQFELVKAMSPCIIFLPNIHDLDRNESDDLSLGILVNSLSRDYEKGSTSNNLVIASTHLPKKVDPSLIAPDKLSTCIKIRRLLIPQQRKHFFTLSYTRGFHLEKQIFHTNRFGSITLGSNVPDLVALTNEALSISIIQKKSIIDTNIIRSALHRQTWDFRSHIREIQDHGILVYQIGRAVSQNILLSNCSLDPISIYMKKTSCQEGDSYLYKWYFELGTSMKKLTILLYLLSCSAGSVAQDFFSLPGPNENNDGITSYRLLENDSDLVHGLLEIEGALLGPSETGSRFDNDGVPLLLRSEPRNPLNMIQNGYSSIVDHRFHRKIYESGFEQGEGVFDPQSLEEDLFNHILWAPRLWRPWGFLFDEGSNELRFPYWEGSFQDKDDYDENGENDSEFLQDGTMQDQTRVTSSNEQGFFQISQFIWDPPDPLFLLFQEDPVFSHQEFDQEFFSPDEKVLLTYQTKKKYWKYLNERWFRKNMEEPNLKFLIDRERWFRTNRSVSNESFRSNTLYESYQYLSNLFLSNGTLLAQITKTLLRKKWVFPDELVVTISSNNERLVSLNNEIK